MALSARGKALKMIALRPHSEQEVRQKLAEKKFSQVEIDGAIKSLYSLNLLDDRAFTKSWIAFRAARPFGLQRIEQELRHKGIAKDILDEEIAQAKGEFDERVVFQLAQRRAQRFASLEPAKRRKRIADFLLRRGFAIDVVMRVIKTL